MLSKISIISIFKNITGQNVKKRINFDQMKATEGTDEMSTLTTNRLPVYSQSIFLYHLNHTFSNSLPFIYMVCLVLESVFS